LVGTISVKLGLGVHRPDNGLAATTEIFGMAEPRDEVEIERVIAVAIYRHDRGDVEAAARSIIA
jgi:hypothetical protein